MYKANVVTFVVTAIVGISLFIVLIFLYDPLGVFNLSSPILSTHQRVLCDYDKIKAVDCEKMMFAHNMRYQAKSMIEESDFDSLLVGSSVFFNSSSEDAGSKLGGNFINLSFSASNLNEKNMIISHALKKTEIKTVIMTLDKNFSQLEVSSPTNPLKEFAVLYDENPINDISVYFNKKYLLCLLRLSKDKSCIGTLKNEDAPFAWAGIKNQMANFGGFTKWTANKLKIYPIKYIQDPVKKKYVKGSEQTEAYMENLLAYFDEHLIDLIASNPTTEFHLVFPPYSTLWYAIWAQREDIGYYSHLEALQYLVEKSAEFSNMKIYAFGDQKFVDNISNYRDLIHYHPRITAFITDSIAEQKYLTEDTIDEYMVTFSDKANNYDLQATLKKVKGIFANKIKKAQGKK